MNAMATAQNRSRIVQMTVKRVLDVQRRAKIKPSEFNPVLLNSPKKRGGANSLDLYYPKS